MSISINPGIKLSPGVRLTVPTPPPIYIMRIKGFDLETSTPGSVITTCNEGDVIWIEVEWAYLTVPAGENSYLQLGGVGITNQDLLTFGITPLDPIPFGSDTSGLSLSGTTGAPIEITADTTTEGNETLTWSWHVGGQIVAFTSVEIVDTSLGLA